ncbi:hypothetical protein CEXT_88541 [Caerostris extrusa]|uniref:Uncharacterized protein n=1 Tax=Caerostris extrusa TaxID=172846 RepID=A0AAV4WRQ2_CAEEX|nr:hypothetical protein CEXT_88541 [Caerostris extrusa]
MITCPRYPPTSPHLVTPLLGEKFRFHILPIYKQFCAKLLSVDSSGEAHAKSINAKPVLHAGKRALPQGPDGRGRKRAFGPETLEDSALSLHAVYADRQAVSAALQTHVIFHQKKQDILGLSNFPFKNKNTERNNATKIQTFSPEPSSSPGNLWSSPLFPDSNAYKSARTWYPFIREPVAPQGHRH